jgi:hypothetical protein
LLPSSLPFNRRDVSQLVGCSQSGLSLWINGRQRLTPVSLELLKVWICKNITPDWASRKGEIMACVSEPGAERAVLPAGSAAGVGSAPLSRSAANMTLTAGKHGTVPVVVLPLALVGDILHGVTAATATVAQLALMRMHRRLTSPVGNPLSALRPVRVPPAALLSLQHADDDDARTAATPAAVADDAVEEPSSLAGGDSTVPMDDDDAAAAVAVSAVQTPVQLRGRGDGDVDMVDGGSADGGAATADGGVPAAGDGGGSSSGGGAAPAPAPAAAAVASPAADPAIDGSGDGGGASGGNAVAALPASSAAAAGAPAVGGSSSGGGGASGDDHRRGHGFMPYDESYEYKSGRRLRPYQVTGVNWILSRWHTRHNAILADEMGLGKTAQSVAFLEHLVRVNHIAGPFLVVAPLSTIEQWRREAEIWTDMAVCVYHDTADGRAVMRDLEWFYEGFNRNVTKFTVRGRRCQHRCVHRCRWRPCGLSWLVWFCSCW